MPDVVPWLELSDAVPDAVPLELFVLLLSVEPVPDVVPLELLLLLFAVPVPDVVSLVWSPVLG